MKRIFSGRALLYTGLSVVIICAAIVVALYFQPVQAPVVRGDLPSYTAEELSKYNGVDTELPIFVALDGYVYDVTAGRSYYGIGGTYHRIAGTDASRELHVFGGSIIKEKYPIVGVFDSKP